MPTEAANITNNPVLAFILYILGLVVGTASLGLEEIDIISAIVFRIISIVALIGGFIASWQKIKAQVVSWLRKK